MNNGTPVSDVLLHDFSTGPLPTFDSWWEGEEPGPAWQDVLPGPGWHWCRDETGLEQMAYIFESHGQLRAQVAGQDVSPSLYQWWPEPVTSPSHSRAAVS
jgi:hypothetical protein